MSPALALRTNLIAVDFGLIVTCYAIRFKGQSLQQPPYNLIKTRYNLIKAPYNLIKAPYTHSAIKVSISHQGSTQPSGFNQPSNLPGFNQPSNLPTFQVSINLPTFQVSINHQVDADSH
jgi:hypothetical protein